MRRISTIRYTVVAAMAAVAWPLAALAATTDADITLVLPSDSSQYTLKSGGTFDNFSISGGTFTFGADSGGTVSVDIRSGGKKTLTNDRNITTVCDDTESKLVITHGAGSTAVTPGSVCGSGGGGGGTSGGGSSSSGGGGGSGSFAAAPAAKTVDKVAQLKDQIAAAQAEIAKKLSAGAGAVATLFTRNLALGDRNDDVKALQQMLATDKTIYPEGLASGLFGPATQRAVKKFQEKYGISQLGNVGPATRAKLNELFGASAPVAPSAPASSGPAVSTVSVPSKTVNPGETSDNVTILQQLLAGDSEVYPEGTISGFYGPATLRAVRRFQLKYGVIQAASDAGNGRVGPKTLAKLSEIFGSVTAPTTAPAVTTPTAPSSATVGTSVPASTAQVKSVQEQIQALQAKILQEQIKLLQEKINAIKK
ncbi:MAG: peptidoglycan-binding protein [Patescibacteria group bacterium]